MCLVQRHTPLSHARQQWRRAPRFGPGRGSVRRHRAQTGASLVEFSIVAIPILMLGLGSIEIAQWFFHKQAISLALVEAGRAAIVDHAHPLTIESVFEEAMLPMFASATQPLSRQRLRQALNERQLKTGAPPWRIEIISPAPAAFHDFSTSTLAIAQQTGLPAIDNTYLADQDARKQAQGWTRGVGPHSGHTIWYANTLVLRLTWLHEPLLPGAKSLIRLMGKPLGSYGQRAMARGGYLPLTQEIALVMQSHPVYWPLPSSGKIVRADAAPLPSPALSAPPMLPPATAAPPHTAPAQQQPTPDAPPVPSGGPIPDAPTQAESTGPAHDLTVAPDNPACGVVLCCG